MKKHFPRLEFFLPLIYMILASVLLLYQKIFPDFSEGFDVFTGEIRIRTSTWILGILSIPGSLVWLLIEYILGRNAFETNLLLKKIMLWSNQFGQFKVSITDLFFVTPLSYFFIGLLIRKYFEKEKKFKRKSPTVRTNNT